MMLERLFCTRSLCSWFRYGPTWSFWIGLEWKLADLWIGAFPVIETWGRGGWSIDLWVCLVPCFPIHLMYSRG